MVVFKCFLIVLLAVVATVVNPELGQANCGIIRIAYSHNWVPVSYDTKDEKGLGIGIAIQREIFNRLNRSYEFVPDLPWKRQLAMLEKGEIDAMAAIYVNPERTKLFDYTRPYYTSKIHVFIHADSALEYSKLQDLTGFTGVAPLGASFGEKFDYFDKNYLNLNRINGTFKILELLQRGRADYFVLPKGLGSYLIAEKSLEGKILISGPAVTINPVHMAFSKASKCKIDVSKINRIIEAMQQDGSLDKIIQAETSRAKNPVSIKQ